jgi:hypothetical protein
MRIERYLPMIPNRIKTIIVLILVIGGIFLGINFLKVGPGVPPPQYLPHLLIPEGDLAPGNCFGQAETRGSIHFVRLGQISDENPALFPALSRHSSYVTYQSGTTNATMIIAAWYFDNERDFSRAQKDLLAYLTAHGTTGTREIILEYPGQCSTSGTGNETKIPGLEKSRTIRGTTYSGKTGSGIFLSVSRPLMNERDDFFIQYYGTADPQGLYGNFSEIFDLVTMNERPYSRTGDIRPLS